MYSSDRSRAGSWCLAMTLAALLATAPTASPAASDTARRTTIMSNKRYEKPSTAELEKRLTPLQYEVTQHAATEPPFRNEFWNNHEPGLYVDVTTGEPLFSSDRKSVV